MQTSKREFGKRLRAAREAADLTQAAFGHALGVQQKTVSEWESGLYEPDIETLGRIAKVARSSVGWLVAGESPPELDDGIRRALIGVRAVIEEMLEDLVSNREKLYGELATAPTVKRVAESVERVPRAPAVPRDSDSRPPRGQKKPKRAADQAG